MNVFLTFLIYIAYPFVSPNKPETYSNWIFCFVWNDN